MKTLAPKVPGGLRVVRIDRLFERLGIALHSEASRRKLEQNGYPGYPGAKPSKLLIGVSQTWRMHFVQSAESEGQRLGISSSA